MLFQDRLWVVAGVEHPLARRRKISRSVALILSMNAGACRHRITQSGSLVTRRISQRAAWSLRARSVTVASAQCTSNRGCPMPVSRGAGQHVSALQPAQRPLEGSGGTADPGFVPQHGHAEGSNAQPGRAAFYRLRTQGHQAYGGVRVSGGTCRSLRAVSSGSAPIQRSYRCSLRHRVAMRAIFSVSMVGSTLRDNGPTENIEPALAAIEIARHSVSAWEASPMHPFPALATASSLIVWTTLSSPRERPGCPAAPGATTAIDGAASAPDPNFGGVINEKASDLKPRRAPPAWCLRKAAPNVSLIMTDDVGFGADRNVRRRHPDAGTRPHRPCRPALHQLPLHLTLLAYPCGDYHRGRNHHVAGVGVGGEGGTPYPAATTR